MTTHRARRIEICDKFAKKALDNPRFGLVWFPEKVARSGRHAEQFLKLQARTDRRFNSPLFYMRRRLNGKAGRAFGIESTENETGLEQEKEYPPVLGLSWSKSGTMRAWLDA